jgi:arylsulfatase A-like enzyme
VQKGSPVNPGASGFDEWLSAPNFFDNDPILSREGLAVECPGESSMVTADAAIEFIRKHAKGDRPFLAVVWFGSPHGPHRAIEQDRKLYDDQPKRKQHFLGEITGMDRAFGKLRKELRTLGIRENTIFWYCSDNGGLPGLGVTGGRGHKGRVYEGGLRVPAILEWPARVPGHRVTKVPCNTSDIYPTLLEIAGVRVEHQPPLDGISLVPLLAGKMEARPRPMGFWDYPAGGIRTPSRQWMAELLKAQKAGDETGDKARLRLDAGDVSKQYPEDSFPGHAAWLDWPWKLHRIQSKKGAVKVELYNLADDPDEKNDLAPAQAARVKALRPALEGWLASVARSLNGKDDKVC